jgi:hypothetical protein
LAPDGLGEVDNPLVHLAILLSTIGTGRVLRPDQAFLR